MAPPSMMKFREEGSLITEAVSPAALLPFPDVYTWGEAEEVARALPQLQPRLRLQHVSQGAWGGDWPGPLSKPAGDSQEQAHKSAYGRREGLPWRARLSRACHRPGEEH